jgi:hypothetical protein
MVAGSIGDKRLRFCPVQHKKARCDGFCKVVFGVSDAMRMSGVEDCHMCYVFVESLDSVLNSR